MDLELQLVYNRVYNRTTFLNAQRMEAWTEYREARLWGKKRRRAKWQRLLKAHHKALTELEVMLVVIEMAQNTSKESDEAES